MYCHIIINAKINKKWRNLLFFYMCYLRTFKILYKCDEKQIPFTHVSHPFTTRSALRLEMRSASRSSISNHRIYNILNWERRRRRFVAHDAAIAICVSLVAAAGDHYSCRGDIILCVWIFSMCVTTAPTGFVLTATQWTRKSFFGPYIMPAREQRQFQVSRFHAAPATLTNEKYKMLLDIFCGAAKGSLSLCCNYCVLCHPWWKMKKDFLHVADIYK